MHRAVIALLLFVYTGVVHSAILPCPSGWFGNNCQYRANLNGIYNGCGNTFDVWSQGTYYDTDPNCINEAANQYPLSALLTAYNHLTSSPWIPVNSGCNSVGVDSSQCSLTFNGPASLCPASCNAACSATCDTNSCACACNSTQFTSTCVNNMATCVGDAARVMFFNEPPYRLGLDRYGLNGAFPLAVTNFDAISLAGNNITGTTAQFSFDTTLVALSLSNNSYLSGTIPVFSASLKYLDVSGTKIVLSGGSVTSLNSMALTLFVSNDGICTNATTCTCNTGYSGTWCSTVMDYCNGVTCGNGGTCVSTPGVGYTCECTPGNSGSLCQDKFDGCLSSPCADNGICTPSNGSYACSCQGGLNGTTCEYDSDVCAPVACSVGSTAPPCHNSGFALVCNCTNSTGNCGTSCSVNPCQHGGVCMPFNSSLTARWCDCEGTGYTGVYCESTTQGNSDMSVFIGGLTQSGVPQVDFNYRQDLCNQTSAGVTCTLGVITALAFAGSSSHHAIETVPFNGANLVNLTTVSWSYTDLLSFTAELQTLANLPKLASVSVTNAVVPAGAAFPTALSTLTKLTHLALPGAGLVGVIPNTLFQNTTTIAYIDLSNNLLTGTIPSYIITHGASATASLFFNNRFTCPITNYSSMGTDDYSSWNCTVNCDGDVHTCALDQACVEATGTCVQDCSNTSPCLNGGTCVYAASTGVSTCSCTTHFNGTKCQNNYNECTTNTCPTGLTCIAGNGTTECVSLNSCDSSPCSNGGTCNNTYNSYTCTCPTGVSGDNCQTDMSHCISSPCANAGTCTPLNTTSLFSCACATGYYGSRCLSEVNFCVSFTGTCKNGGFCDMTETAAFCHCAAGYEGADCSTQIDNCAIYPCMHGGTCTNGVNTRSCSCVPGYTGWSCQVLTNNCVSSQCAQGSTCINGVNTYSCS